MTKFIKLPSHVQEMIEAETHEIINRAERETPLLVNRSSFWINTLIHELKEAKATAYFREMELIEQITELRKQNENKSKTDRSELNEKARNYLSNQGFGTGTNITLHGAMCLMVDFFLDNQIKNENE